MPFLARNRERESEKREGKIKKERERERSPIYCQKRNKHELITVV